MATIDTDPGGQQMRTLTPEQRRRALALMAELVHTPDEEVDDKVEELERITECPHVVGYLFHHTPHLTDEQALEKALAYEHIALPGA
ncbi:hypothetical protein ACFQO7_17610 [Catellatospora aurea]|uniref:Uncharacterized protein n=1 Tax=Catellatospora aurea TaxID=1337874 RepID=A0ABW2H125_9ACTN